MMIYSIIAIPLDALYGDVTDKAPIWIKLMMTFGMIIIFSGAMFVFSEKPEGDFELNTNLFLDKYGSDYCNANGKIPLFVPTDENSVYTDSLNNETEQEIPDGIQII
jgi:hypothetical protein